MKFKSHYQVPLLLERELILITSQHSPHAQSCIVALHSVPGDQRLPLRHYMTYTQTYKGFVSDHSVEHVQCQNGTLLGSRKGVSAHFVAKDSNLFEILTPIWTTCLGFLLMIILIMNKIAFWVICVNACWNEVNAFSYITSRWNLGEANMDFFESGGALAPPALPLSMPMGPILEYLAISKL